MKPGPVSQFIDLHYRHFNAAALKDAAEAYSRHLDSGGIMLVTLAGAMSTAELGISLAEMIRQGKVHGIVCTGANLEEDIFNLVAHDFYERIPHYRDLTPADEQALLQRHMNRVTDTCIPEMEAMRRIENVILKEWMDADARGERLFPHEFFWRILDSPDLKKSFQIDPKDSWMVAAKEKNLPMFVPGWEDSTLGNMYAGHCIEGDVKNVHTVRSGIEYMIALADWYAPTSHKTPIGFFQIGGGIAGDFPSASSPCSTRTSAAPMSLSGPTSARSAIPRPATAATPEPSPTKKSPGANSAKNPEVHHRVRRHHRRPPHLRQSPRMVIKME